MTARNNIQNYARTFKRQIILIILVVVTIGFWLLFHFVYENPTRVFNGMLSSSLSTTGVVEKISAINDEEFTEQFSLIQLGGRNRLQGSEAQAVVGSKTVNVLSAKVGTPSTDYSSFVSIESGQRNKSGKLINYDPILNIWARTTYGSPTGGQLLRDSILNAILIGDVTNAQKQQILSYIHENNVYKIISVKKIKAGSRLEYQYSVQVNLEPYSVILNTFDRDLGYKVLSIANSSTLANQSIKLSLTVDVLSRHLMQLSYVGEDTTENYSSYGIREPIKVPKNSITVAKLESKINSIANQ